jgi:hypothetical protein
VDTPPLLDLLDIRPVWVDDLGMDALVLLAQKMVLIDSGLCPDRVARVVDHVLAAAAARLAA